MAAPSRERSIKCIARHISLHPRPVCLSAPTFIFLLGPTSNETNALNWVVSLLSRLKMSAFSWHKRPLTN